MAGSAFWRQATLDFAAGVLGALVNRLFWVLLGALSITPAPEVTRVWLYTALVWGGLWGFLFLIPWKTSWWLRGLVFSLVPTAATWFVVYPYMANIGVLGLNRGILGPILPIIANGIWGLVAAWWLEFVGARAAVAS